MKFDEWFANGYGKGGGDDGLRELLREAWNAASRPEEQALSLLRQLVNLTEHFEDAVWYDKDNVRHPAVTPLVQTLAAEVRQYLDEREPQKESSK
jgi:ribosomal protein S15P/S13E